MTSVVESFALVLTANTEELISKTVVAKNKTQELEKTLEKTEGASKSLSSSLLNLAKSYTGVILGAASLGGLIAGTAAYTKYADNLGIISKRLNVNVEDLDAWGGAVKREGGSAQEFQSTVERLSNTFGQFANKVSSEQSILFRSLGVSMTDASGKAKDVLQVLPQLADAFQGLDRQRANSLGMRLGLDQGTIALLQKGRAEVDVAIKRQKELGVVTKEDAELSRKFNQQWEDTSRSFNKFFGIVGSMVLPIFSKIGKALEKVGTYVSTHKDLIIGFAIAAGSAITLYLIPPLIRAAIAAVTLASPFYAVIGIVALLTAAFAIFYEDWQAFSRGDSSFIGDMVKEFPALIDVFETLSNVFGFLWETAQLLFSYLISALKDVFNAVSAIVGGIFKAVEFVSNLFSSSKKFEANGTQSIFSILKDDRSKEAMNSAGKTMNSINQNPLSSINSNSISYANSQNNRSSSNNVTVDKINISTQATSVDDIASNIASALNDKFNNAQLSYADGLRA